MKTSELVEDNFKGLSEFIKEKEILDFYKGLICTVINDSREQAVNEALRMASERAKVSLLVGECKKECEVVSELTSRVDKKSILSLAPEILDKLK